MVVEYIRYKVDTSQIDYFIAAYKKAFSQLEASQYCIAYELAACEEEAGRFILRIEWTSTQDHLQGFRKSDLFPGFFAHVAPYFQNIEEMHHYTPVDN